MGLEGDGEKTARRIPGIRQRVNPIGFALVAFQDADEVLRRSRTWRPGCKARRQGMPACRQGRGRRIKEMAVACSGRGAPAAQWGCHGADGPYRAPSGTPDRLMGRHARPLPQAWSAGEVTRPVPCAEMISSRRAGILDSAALQPAGTAAHSPWPSHLVSTGHESCGLAPRRLKKGGAASCSSEKKRS